MYEQKILDRLASLQYLDNIKNSNISHTSKSNDYNDVVKFFAQINKDEVIQQISYKATGCTYFIVFCDLFCEMVEGKNIHTALKISSEQLSSLAILDESKIHIVDIILITFSTMIKKYQIGVEKGTILPFAVIEKKETLPVNKEVDNSIKHKVIDEEVDLSDILYKKTNAKPKTHSTNKKSLNVENSKNDNDNKNKIKDKQEKNIDDLVSNKDNTKEISNKEKSLVNNEIIQNEKDITNIESSDDRMTDNIIASHQKEDVNLKYKESNKKDKKAKFDIKDIKKINMLKEDTKNKNEVGDIDNILHRINTTKLSSKNNMSIKENNDENKNVKRKPVNNMLDTLERLKNNKIANIDTVNELNSKSKKTNNLSENMFALKSMLKPKEQTDVNVITEEKIKVEKDKNPGNKTPNLTSMLSKLESKKQELKSLHNTNENKLVIDNKQNSEKKTSLNNLASISQGLSSIRKNKTENNKLEDNTPKEKNNISSNVVNENINLNEGSTKVKETKKQSSQKGNKSKSSSNKNSSKSSINAKSRISNNNKKEEKKEIEEDIFAGLKYIDEEDDDFDYPVKKKKGLFGLFKR